MVTARFRSVRLLKRLTAPLAVALVLAAAHAPTRANDADMPPSCRGLDAEQGGVVLPAVDGVITLARQPFVLRLQNAGFAPGLHVAREAGLAKALATVRHRLLWLSGGDWLAGEPGQLIVDATFELHAPNARQTAFAAAFGDSAVRLLGPGAATVPLPALAGKIPRNGMFEPPAAAGPRLYPVRLIDAAPVERSTMPALHLVLITARQGFPSEPASLFYRGDWSACTLRF